MSEQQGGWVYRTFRWRDGDGDATAWRQAIADDGWEGSEYGEGAWSVIDGVRTFGVVVRRWMDRPNAIPPR